MDVVATLDPSNRRWTYRSVEHITATVSRSDGYLDAPDIAGIGFSSYDTPPSAWLTPTSATRSPDVNTVTCQLLVGSGVQPAGVQWVWLLIDRDDENLPRRCSNARMDFTAADWVEGFEYIANSDGTASLYGVTFTDNGDGTDHVTGPVFVDHGDGTATLTG